MRRTFKFGLCLTLLFAGFSKSLAAEDQPDSSADGPLIVHEWGTFTTFSGSDGVFLDFRPLANEISDLPSFVLDRANQGPLSVLSKKRLRGRVRMETPVTYFYTDQIREVSVRVGFPKGLLTEFYPPVKSMLPKFDHNVAYRDGEPLGNSELDWGTVTLIPVDELAPSINDKAFAKVLAERLAERVVPTDQPGGHYGQARATDSALIAVHQPITTWMRPDDQLHLEKFLFYRGVGRFELPLKAVFDGSEALSLSNVSQDPISAAIRVDVQGDQIQIQEFGSINAGKVAVAKSPETVDIKQLSDRVVKLLVAEGLYEKEARSMVETWKLSWFAEQGSRVLYMVPPRVTDELLPLTIKPVPDETLRVLVGRLELMTPDMEQKMIHAVQLSSQERSKFQKSNAGKVSSFPISKQIQSLGRMTEPALIRVSKIADDDAVRREAEMLIQQMRAD